MPDRRVKRYLHVEAEGFAALPRSFRIDQEFRNERKRSNSNVWLTDSSLPQSPHVPVIENLTRREVVQLIESLAGWLAYEGEG